MFDDLSNEGWLIVVVALILGFGIVRLVISAVKGKSTGIPKSPGKKSSQSEHDRDEEFHSDQQTKKTSRHEPQQSGSTKIAWHEVLGVAPSASSDEIRGAYKRKMSQYHPDKVASLGEEFMEIAVNRSKEINVAYKKGMALRA